VETLESIWYWLVFGVLLSAAISTFVPVETMQSFASLGPLGTALIMLVISLPMYVCSTSSVPIAAALVAGGMPHGAALVFLVAGPASNVATIGAVYKTFGARVSAVYLAVVALGSLGLGMLFDGMDLAGTAVVGHEHQAGPLAWASLVVVVGALGLFAFRWARGLWGRRGQGGRNSAPATASEDQVRSFQVQGMTCQNCARRVEASATGTKGVQWAKVHLDQQRLEVSGSASDQEIQKALDAAGYKSQRVGKGGTPSLP
jgi:copper chaperone CopZ